MEKRTTNIALTEYVTTFRVFQGGFLDIEVTVTCTGAWHHLAD